MDNTIQSEVNSEDSRFSRPLPVVCHESSPETMAEPDDVLCLHEVDVLCGRGSVSFNHCKFSSEGLIGNLIGNLDDFPFFLTPNIILAGNKVFRAAVTTAVNAFLTASARFEKSLVVRLVVGFVHANGGRFLKQKGSSAMWLVLNDVQVREKVGHAIRDAAVALKSRQFGGHKGRCVLNSTFDSAVETLRALLTSSVLEKSCISLDMEDRDQLPLPPLSEHRLARASSDTNRSDSMLNSGMLSTHVRHVQRSHGSKRSQEKVSFESRMDLSLDSLLPESQKHVHETVQNVEVLNDDFKEMCGKLVDPSPQYSRQYHLHGFVESVCGAEQGICGEFSWEASFAQEFRSRTARHSSHRSFSL
jgi:hypothetical protein